MKKAVVGCVHNVERVFEYPERVKKNGNTTFEAGDFILLKCPHGCPDIVISLKDDEMRKIGRK